MIFYLAKKARVAKFPSMFHVRFGSRLQSEFCIPKGPRFENAKRIKFTIDGSIIELSAPRQHAQSFETNLSPKSSYSLDQVPVESGGKWKSFNPMVKVWDFCGPWFTGVLGTLRLYVTIIGPQNSLQGASLFHPAVFEKVLSDYLTDRNADYDLELSGRQRKIAPVDWEVKKHFPCLAAKYDVLGGEEERGGFDRCLVFPVSDTFFCKFCFVVNRAIPYVRSPSEPESNTDEWISDQPMIELADQILNSIEVTLSQQAKNQQAKALEGVENPHLSETFAPLNWGPEGGSEVNDRLLAEFIQQNEAKKQLKQP